MQSEKESEYQLQTILIENKFNIDCIYYSIFNNKILKELFSNCSKTGNKFGVPDRIYFDKSTLIIFECKNNNLNKANDDIKTYIQKLKPNNYKIFGVGFVNKNLFSIYKLENNNIIHLPNKLITLNTFNIIKNTSNTVNMKNEIHKIHNYIRNYTKISDEDKAFFIAIILISIKKTSFKTIYEKYNNKEYIYDIVLDNLNDFNIDIEVFKFLRNDNNNTHFYNLIKMIYEIYEKEPTIDLLNEFYSEFVKYNNSDGKKLGIVLTPSHIVKLMCELLEINNNDIVLDLCTGTGSYLLEAYKYKPKQLIGCEFQNKLYALLKCNTILRDINNINLIKGNCFENEFKATKSIINPPYGQTNENIYKFILKQIESIHDGGLACAIIPRSKLTNNKNNDKYKKELMQQAIIKSIVICRNTLFYPYASVDSAIILIQKNKNGHAGNTNIVDYSDDGFESKINHGFIKTDEFENKYNNIKTELLNIGKYELKYNTNWCLLNNNEDNDLSEILKKIKLQLLDNEYQIKRNEILNSHITISNLFTFKKFKIDELFIILSKPDVEYQENKIVNLISAKNNNNGVKCKIESNNETFYGNKLVVITAGNGGAGMCFYQADDFNLTSATKVLSPKNIILNKKIGIFIANILSENKKKYSRSNTWKLTDIKNTIIELPMKDNNIDYEYIENLF